MIAQKTVNYATETDALLELVRILVVDIKAKKSLGEDLKDLVAPFITAVGGLGDLKVEVADKKALALTVEMKVNEIVEALLAS